MRRIWTMLGLLLLALAGCEWTAEPADHVLGPDRAAPSLAAGYVEGWSSDNASDLQALLQQERDRIRLESERSAAPLAPLASQADAVVQQISGQGVSPLLRCDPLPYAGHASIVGPEGGELTFGPHRLTIPRGALRQYTVITAETPVSTTVGVKLSPHGLRFTGRPTLTLDYGHCTRPHGLPYRAVYLDDAGTILEWVPSHDRRAEREVEARIGHFSKYALATP